MIEPHSRLTFRQIFAIIVLALLFGAPAVFIVETGSGPARWLVAAQDRLFGGHFPVSTMVLVFGLELVVVGAALLFVAVLVRALTGRTVVQWVSGGSSPKAK